MRQDLSAGVSLFHKVKVTFDILKSLSTYWSSKLPAATNKLPTISWCISVVKHFLNCLHWFCSEDRLCFTLRKLVHSFQTDEATVACSQMETNSSNMLMLNRCWHDARVQQHNEKLDGMWSLCCHLSLSFSPQPFPAASSSLSLNQSVHLSFWSLPLLSPSVPPADFVCVLQEVWACWCELLSYLEQENAFLDQLEQKLDETDNLQGGAEELQEALDVSIKRRRRKRRKRSTSELSSLDTLRWTVVPSAHLEPFLTKYWEFIQMSLTLS